MWRMHAVPVVLAMVGMMATATVTAGDEASLKDRWNLAAIYRSREGFDQARRELASRLPELQRGKGQLGTSPQGMLAALEGMFALVKELQRVNSYASMWSDEDTRVPEAMAARQEAAQLGTEFAANTAWMAPEILALPPGTVARFLAAEPGLAPYRFFLEDLERQRPHTLTPGEETLLAQSGRIARAASSFYTILANADLPFPTVTLSSGEQVQLNQAAYTRYRALPDRQDRVAVFTTFWSAFKAFERTFGTSLDAQVNRDIFYARARNHPSALASSLHANHIPEGVYRTLIAEVNRALPTLHRAFRIRGRLLGISDLAYHDIFPPLTPDLDMEFPIDRARALVLESLAPLGEEYVAAVEKGFADRWMDVYPRPGKRSGAYSNGSVYDVHPFILLNYNDDYESLSTMTHEWGHAMHSHLANAAQPFPTADYAIFVAEVASTFHEALLLEHLLGRADGDEERLYLLGSYLEGLRGTYFRQTMFAEFELAIHEAAERGEALTGARLTEMYGELLRRYHGHDQGVMKIDDAYTVEWAYIPHFYYNFYVYQYATALAASTQLARDVVAGAPGARDRYLGVLRAGGSRYPYELLREAGVDLATAAPYRALEERMNWAMDEIEQIIARREAAR